MKIRRKNFKKNAQAENFWPSFTDVMSTISLVLFFLMLLAYIQYIVAGKNLEIAGKNLEFLKKQLIDTEEKLGDTEEKLELSKIEIRDAMDVLMMLEQEIEKTRAEVEQGKLELKLSQEELAEKERIIANSNQELEKLRAKLQNIAVLRVEVLSNVKKSIEQVLGETNERGEPLVTIVENANLVVNESLLFEFASADISYEGRRLLGQLAIAFENILDDLETREFIDTIHIEGHADSIGPSADNLELSSRRADNVLNYMMESNPDLEQHYARYFAASGFSEHRPINLEDTPEGRSYNRRIEISINIKDSNVQKIIDEYLGSN
jgi:chemotaxis protein MotB